MKLTRIYLLLLLILINILSYVDRHMLPAFASQIAADLHLTRQQFGLLTGFAFVAVYAVSGPMMGVLADRFQPGKVIACGLLLWSVMTACTGLTKSFLHVLAPRMLVGVGEATLLPASAALLGRLFAPGQRATVFGLLFMGSQIGIGLAYWLAGNLGNLLSWRQVFYLLGAVGVLLCLLTLPFFRLGRQQGEGQDAPAAQPPRAVADIVRELVTVFRTNANFRRAAIGVSLTQMLYASGQFMQLWLVADKAMVQTTASSLYGNVFLMCAIPSSLVGGLAADWYCRRFDSTRAMFVVLVLSACAPLLILFRLSAPGSTLFYVGMGASVCMLALTYGAMFSLVLDHAPPAIQSTAVGFTMFIANVLVIGTGTYGIGLLADLLESHHMAVPLTTALLCADGVTLLSIPVYYALHRHSRRRAAPAPAAALLRQGVR